MVDRGYQAALALSDNVYNYTTTYQILRWSHSRFLAFKPYNYHE